MMRRGPGLLAMQVRLLACAALLACGALRAGAAEDPPPAAEEPTHVSLRGQVMWLGEALRKQGDTEFDADFGQSTCVLLTGQGEIVPLVKDARGRGFWLDERLRQRELELYVQRVPRSPLVQVIRVYALEKGQKLELDYWCDICSIPMYELKACECCQGPTRIRLRPVEEAP